MKGLERLLVSCVVLAIVGCGNRTSVPPHGSGAAAPSPSGTASTSPEGKVDEAFDAFTRGCDKFDNGQFEDAVVEFSKAIEFDRTLAMAYNNRGATLKELRQGEKAIADFTKAMECEPTLEIAYNNRGTVYEELGKNEEAIADYTRAIECNSRLAMAYCNRAITYSEIGESDKAIADFRKAIECDMTFAMAYCSGLATYEEYKARSNADLVHAVAHHRGIPLVCLKRAIVCGTTYRNLDSAKDAVTNFQTAKRLQGEQ